MSLYIPFISTPISNTAFIIYYTFFIVWQEYLHCMIVRNLRVQDPRRKEQWQKYVRPKSRIWLNFRVSCPYCSVIQLFISFHCFPYCCNYYYHYYHYYHRYNNSCYCHYYQFYDYHCFYYHYYCHCPSFSSSLFASARWCFDCMDTCTHKSNSDLSACLPIIVVMNIYALKQIQNQY